MDLDKRREQLRDASEQLAGTPEDADRELVHGMLLETHTLLPGVLVSYDNTLQTAEVQPAIRRLILPDCKLVNLPPCVRVPVFFPGGVLTFEVVKGDNVVLAFSERAIDAWWSGGGIQDPTELRHHDLSDAFALIGFQPKPSALSDVYQGGAELRVRNGTNRLSVRNDGSVHIGTSASASALTPMTNGLVLGMGIDTLTELPFSFLGDSSMTVMAKT